MSLLGAEVLIFGAAGHLIPGSGFSAASVLAAVVPGSTHLHFVTNWVSLSNYEVPKSCCIVSLSQCLSFPGYCLLVVIGSFSFARTRLDRSTEGTVYTSTPLGCKTHYLG
jgi:hypothetical protein